MNSESTVFQRIITREIPAQIVAETDRVIAFYDISPQAPVHVVVTTKDPQYQNVVELAAAAPELLAELVAVANQVAVQLCAGQFRMIFNNGALAGQTVFQVHAHVLGGDLQEGKIVG